MRGQQSIDELLIIRAVEYPPALNAGVFPTAIINAMEKYGAIRAIEQCATCNVQIGGSGGSGGSAASAGGGDVGQYYFHEPEHHQNSKEQQGAATLRGNLRP